jgi:dipeptidyl-peptidase-3
MLLNSAYKNDWKTVQAKSGISDRDLDHFLHYAAQFLGNGGNYKSFGDSKIIPRIAPEKLEVLATVSDEGHQLWLKFKDLIYENKDVGLMHLGYPDAGHLSNYYPDSPDITKDEITAVSKLLEGKKLLPENTRIRKNGDVFEVLIASAQTDPAAGDRDLPESEWTIDGKKVVLKFGDHAREMKTIADAMSNAKKYVANETQKSMMTEYVKSFATGSLEAFKESQRHWVQDKGPMVESDIGFIETYRDPHGIRGEWEGFAAMVNKERTLAFGKLVDAAPSLLPKLPWSKDFEKDTFNPPDFTSLEVLSFAG